MKTKLSLTMLILISLAIPARASEPAVGAAGTTPGLLRSHEDIVFFKSTAETGDLSEWVGDGGGHVFSFTGEDWKSAMTQAVQANTEQAHSGRYSIRCCIPDPKKGQDAKLYRERILQPAAYYSAWFWFDKNFKPTKWVNIFHVKGANTRDARGDHPNDSPGTVLWGVGIYSSKGNTGPLLAYVDDMLVTNCQVGR
jgi:hypothetical protein